MEQFYQIYIGILVFSAIVSAAMLSRLWPMRHTAGTRGLMSAIFFVAFWSLAYIMEISALPMDGKIFWAKVQFMAIPFAPVGLFTFALHYTGRGSFLTRSRESLFYIPGIITILLAFSNEKHGQIWREIALTNNQPFGPLALDHGIGFYLVSLYLYILILLSTVFFLQIALQASQLYRNQARIMLAGMLVPWVANFLYIARINPAQSLDLTPVALTLTNLALSFAFSRYRLVDIRPIAHTTLFNAMSAGIMVLDQQERIIDINPAGQQILQTSSNIIGAAVQNLLPEWDEWKKRGIKEKAPQELSLASGSSFEISVTPIQDGNQKQNGLLLVLTDISALKRANEEMREANRMKTQLLANVSHDFRSPLGAIIGYAEMLKGDMFGPQNAEQRNATAEILDSANQLLAFANNLIGQAQLETGKIMLRDRPFSPIEITDSIHATLHFHAAKKNLEFVQDVDPNLPEQILGDVYWLRQIVVNLLNNAVKFTSSGQVRLNFKLFDDNHWMIEVSDDGIGISPEDQALIFEAFQQSNHPAARKQYGSGLGLSIVKELTRLMQGKIELSSELGKGSTFRVILPLKLPE